MAFGSYNGYAYVYTFDGSKFTLNQTLSLSRSIYSLDLTNDHLELAIATYYYVYIYKYNGTAFTSSQTINPGTSYFTRISLTEDHQYLTFADDYLAFVYNNTGSSYQLIENNGQFNKKHKKRVYHLSFGYDTKLLAASTNDGVSLYSKFDEGNAEFEQTLDSGNSIYTHEISKDGTYLALADYSNLKIYMKEDYIRCNISYCTNCLNSTHCQHCN